MRRVLSTALFVLSTVALLCAQAALPQRLQSIVQHSALRSATVGMQVVDLQSGRKLVSLNADKLFFPGSTTKVVTETTALALLGPDYRFHTRVYRTGPVDDKGELKGDLVLVASGDPNLSARVQPNGTLAFTSNDHVYAGVLPGIAVEGDPLLPLRKLAETVAKSGIRLVRGSVRIDASLFESGAAEPATKSVISPIVVNDNLIDVTVLGGAKDGDATSLVMQPLLPYLKIVNRTRTGPPNSQPSLQFIDDVQQPDGAHTATLTGTVPAQFGRGLIAYKVKDPTRFATDAFREALQGAGVVIAPLFGASSGTAAVPEYTPDRLVGEYVSPPFSQDVRVTLKASQNLHAALVPYLLGSVIGHDSAGAAQTGFDLERNFLAKAGLQPETVSQLDGEGGVGAAFSPEFMTRLLAYAARQPYSHALVDALPVLGRDGTLQETLQSSPAAGHVYAKTGSYTVFNALDRGVLLMGKSLVGYVDARNGHRLAFAFMANLMPLANYDEGSKVGDALAQMAEAVYLSQQ